MKYAQTALKLEELRLPGLDGMLPGADVKARGSNEFERIVKVGNQVVDEYRHYIDDLVECRCEPLDHVYDEIYERVEKELLKDVDFNQKDMEDYIFMKANGDYEDDETLILGLYTGCLLHLLTLRNREKGEKTIVHLNGGEDFTAFDHLFYYAKHVDELVVENFFGDYLCANIASYGGKADYVALIRCGDYSVAEGIAHAGEIKTLAVIDCIGDFNSNIVASNGKIGSAILVGNTLCREGSDGLGCSIANHGEAGLVMGVCGYIREPFLPSAFIDADVNLIIASKVSSTGSCNPKAAGLIYLEDIVTERDVAWGHAEYDGNINTIMVSNCKADSIAERVGMKGNVKKLVSHKNECKEFAKDAHIDNIVEGEDAAQEYERVRKEYGIAKMLELANTIIHESSTEEILKLTKQIHEIYESVKPKLEALKQE